MLVFQSQWEAQEFSEHGNSYEEAFICWTIWDALLTNVKYSIFNKNIYILYKYSHLYLDCISLKTFLTLCFISFARWFVKKVTS